jgi:endonuclease/exonuclease/phosphatase family metal-dependent hydrolase
MRIFVFLCILPFSVFAEELRLLTWNVYMFPRPFIFAKQKIRTPLIVKALLEADHDVIFLNEAFSSSFRRKITRALDGKYPYKHVLSRGRLDFLNSGLYVASKYPYEILEALNYTDCDGIDCLAGKGVMLIEVGLPSGRRVQIAATHAQANGHDAAKAVRAKQFDFISSLFKKHRRPGVSQVLTGDLNVNGKIPNDNRPEYHSMLARLGMVDGPLTGEYDYTASYAVECYKRRGGVDGSVLDYALLLENGSGAQLSDRQAIPFFDVIKGKSCPLSDHFGLESVLRFYTDRS